MATERGPLGDPATSRAVLIGTAEYHHPSYTKDDQLPEVAANLARLGLLLRQEEVPWGLNPAHCTVVLNPESSDQIIKAVQKADAGCTGTLFIYYAGHGFIAPEEPEVLFLTIPDSEQYAKATALDFRHLRSTLSDCRAPNKILILDCCYSGKATRATRTLGPAVERVAVNGTFVLAATGPQQPAIAESDTQLTAFTNEFVAVLGKYGVPGGGEFVTIEEIANETHTRLIQAKLPTPTRHAQGPAATVAIFQNVAHRTTVARVIGILTEDAPDPARLVPARPPVALAEVVAGLIGAVALGILGYLVLTMAGERSDLWALRAAVVTGLLAVAAHLATAAWLSRRHPS